MYIVWFIVVGAILLLAVAYVMGRGAAKGFIDEIVGWVGNHAEIVEKEK